MLWIYKPSGSRHEGRCVVEVSWVRVRFTWLLASSATQGCGTWAGHFICLNLGFPSVKWGQWNPLFSALVRLTQVNDSKPSPHSPAKHVPLPLFFTRKCPFAVLGGGKECRSARCRNPNIPAQWLLLLAYWFPLLGKALRKNFPLQRSMPILIFTQSFFPCLPLKILILALIPKKKDYAIAVPVVWVGSLV